ncbi:hypothetical protein T492DRAFT_837070 [Pavlovales sp. CCMP2436]|nr:hypothetical protein T492DRAFT_837070 [Pavlovales sp. CCMP2436]
MRRAFAESRLFALILPSPPKLGASKSSDGFPHGIPGHSENDLAGFPAVFLGGNETGAGAHPMHSDIAKEFSSLSVGSSVSNPARSDLEFGGGAGPDPRLGGISRSHGGSGRGSGDGREQGRRKVPIRLRN